MVDRFTEAQLFWNVFGGWSACCETKRGRIPRGLELVTPFQRDHHNTLIPTSGDSFEDSCRSLWKSQGFMRRHRKAQFVGLNCCDTLLPSSLDSSELNVCLSTLGYRASCSLSEMYSIP